MTSQWKTYVSWLWFIFPHHTISRVMFKLTRIRFPLTPAVIRLFIYLFKVDMDEAQECEPSAYPTFNAFFTRRLKLDARPIALDRSSVISPADGTISQIGDIRDEYIVQAKGRDYSILELLGGSSQRSLVYEKGRFCTIYLSPRDYHRVHMPTQGNLREMVYIPGRLFGVAPANVDCIPRLFSRNERVATIFEARLGPMALVLVGALNVAAIETVWSGLITPPPGDRIQVFDYGDGDSNIDLEQGQEMGRFNMGSTVILLFPPNTMTWLPELQPGDRVKMGQRLGRLVDP